jgi:hypothetical protein
MLHSLAKEKVLMTSGARLAFSRIIQYAWSMPERTQRPPGPAPWGPKEGDSGGPKPPDVSKPDVKDLLQRMRKVDPNQSRRYRQRTGQ